MNCMILNFTFYYSVIDVKFIFMRDKTREYLNVFSVLAFGKRQKTVWVGGSGI